MPDTSLLQTLSKDLSFAVEKAGVSLVRVDDQTRLTATGTIWSSDGIIVATSHGVEQDEGITVELHSGAIANATVLGRDPETDIAVLKVDRTDLSPIQKIEKPASIGSFVLAIGRPGNSGLQATFGIISSTQQTRSGGENGRVYHTDAILYPGFSGGALINAEGNFVGLLNLGWGRGRGVAIGPTIVQEVVDAITEHGRVQRGYLGVATQPVAITSSLRTSLKRENEAGLLIVSVEENSPAEKAGLLIGDTILAVNGSAAGEPQDLRSALRSLRPGQKIAVEVVHGGKATTVEAELGVRE